jgi:hypothetical protein
VVVIGEYWEEAARNATCGHAPCRAHILSRLSALLQLSEETKVRSALVDTLRELFEALRKNWDTFLPPFAVFQSTTTNTKKVARAETTRLEEVAMENSSFYLSVTWLEAVETSEPVSDFFFLGRFFSIFFAWGIIIV